MATFQILLAAGFPLGGAPNRTPAASSTIREQSRGLRGYRSPAEVNMVSAREWGHHGGA